MVAKASTYIATFLPFATRGNGQRAGILNQNAGDVVTCQNLPLISRSSTEFWKILNQEKLSSLFQSLLYYQVSPNLKYSKIIELTITTNLNVKVYNNLHSISHRNRNLFGLLVSPNNLWLLDPFGRNLNPPLDQELQWCKDHDRQPRKPKLGKKNSRKVRRFFRHQSIVKDVSIPIRLHITIEFSLTIFQNSPCQTSCHHELLLR